MAVEGERLFRGLVEASPIPMLVITADADGRVLLMNAKFTQTFGYTPADVPDVAAWWPQAYPDPEYRAVIRQTWLDVVSAAEKQGLSAITPVAARVTCRDGLVREVEVHMSTCEGRGLVLFNDLTERKRAEERVRQSEERYRLIVENQTEFIVKWRPDGTRTFVNERYCQGFGLREEDCLGTSFLPLVAPEFRAEVERLIAALSPAAPEFTEEHLSLVPGGERWEQWTNRGIFDGDGKLVEVLSSGRDITERKRLEEQLRQSQKMQAIGQLAGGVAHDFNNLLTVINSCAALLLADSRSDPRTIPDLVAIRDAGERAAQLTRQLLLFSRKAVSEPRPLDLTEVVRLTSHMLLRLIGEHIRVELDLAAGLPWVQADPAQLEQVLLNLALNGRDALPAGGTLKIATDAVDIRRGDPRLPPERRAGRYVHLLVADDGTGMSPEVQAHLFEPFFTTKGVGKGTGLGLAAVFGIVEGSEGFLSVSTTPGAGTEVHVFLPAIAASARVGPEPAAPERSAPGGHETLLLVEDEDGVRRLGERILTEHGYHVLTASSGEKALDLLAANGAIDLLITDEVMPGMSGHTLAETVRRKVPRCSVLFVSGYSAPEAHEPWHDNAESAFLQKPFTPVVLAKKVRELLDGGR
jgi:two-component system, cell cycle sensor histidine kinase and response regulator CckA